MPAVAHVRSCPVGEPLRPIDADDLARRTAVEHSTGERPGSAADVQPAWTGWNCEPSRNRGATSKADWLAAGLPTERAAPVSLRAADVVDGAVPVCAPDDLVRMAAAQARDVGWDTGIVNDGGVVLGRLHLDRVDPTLDVPVEEVLEPGRPPCAPTPRSTPPWRGCGTEASPPSW